MQLKQVKEEKVSEAVIFERSRRKNANMNIDKNKITRQIA